MSGARTTRSPGSSDTLTPAFRRPSRTPRDDRRDRDEVAALVARAKAGDRDAVRALYVRFADEVYGYAAAILRDEHEAEDVTQHVFAKLMTVLPRYEERQVPFAAWILRVTRNVAVDHVRRLRAVPCEEVRAEDGLGDDDGVGRERRLLLDDALRDLPEDQRRVVLLRHVAGLTPGEIAERLGRSEPSVHGLHNRGRGALRRALTDSGCAPTVRRRAAA